MDEIPQGIIDIAVQEVVITALTTIVTYHDDNEGAIYYAPLLKFIEVARETVSRGFLVHIDEHIKVYGEMCVILGALPEDQQFILRLSDFQLLPDLEGEEHVDSSEENKRH